MGTLVWLYHQSYLGEINIRPSNLNALVAVINKLRKDKASDSKMLDNGSVQYSGEYLYLEFLSDALEKLGFLYFARDRLKKYKRDLHAGKYHVYNSIFDCKAFLDTIAGLLNHHYKLETRRIQTDLKHTKFLQKLADKNSKLAREISRFEVWIKAISKWRNILIHRHGIFLLFHKDDRYLMPTKPKRFAEILLSDEPLVDPIEFCEENIKYAKLIFEIVCGHIQRDLTERLSK